MNRDTETKEALARGLRVANTLYEMVKEAKRIPSGELYALVMPTGLDLETYERFINVLVEVTRDLIRAGQLLKIEVLDHLIIGEPEPTRPRGYTSMRELGYFYSNP